MDHVIWMGHQILKLASNFEMFIYSFVFGWIEKKVELLCNIFIEITQPFLYLEGAPKYILQQHLKNTITKVFRYLTQISTFNAPSKWHDPCIKSSGYRSFLKLETLFKSKRTRTFWSPITCWQTSSYWYNWFWDCWQDISGIFRTSIEFYHLLELFIQWWGHFLFCRRCS